MGPGIAPRSAWDQSDIVNSVYFAALDAKMPAVLLTPACDVEQGKVSFWTFAALFPDAYVVRQIFASEIADWNRDSNGRLVLTNKQRDSLHKKIWQLVDHRFPRYHWLPIALAGVPAHVIDFSCLTCLPVEEVQNTAVRAWSLISSWREQIPARYSAYMSRVGTEDYIKAEVELHVDRLLEALIAAPPPLVPV